MYTKNNAVEFVKELQIKLGNSTKLVDSFESIDYIFYCFIDSRTDRFSIYSNFPRKYDNKDPLQEIFYVVYSYFIAGSCKIYDLETLSKERRGVGTLGLKYFEKNICLFYKNKLKKITGNLIYHPIRYKDMSKDEVFYKLKNFYQKNGYSVVMNLDTIEHKNPYIEKLL
ncbi:hypothetical protein AWE51_16305 [Aquimarina aggregata]|uniref:Uncharacterized protein n=1 Tax=Aquimarina aggregata TaxID=1642818 RepID=A0A163D1F0_9FLAO|nr:hypothetical protein [Aquimarina aggregata]KZS42924.1 hypothetical protein AWE51_16305 [Aquimarina aggregata]